MPAIHRISRRDFLAAVGVGTGGLTLGVWLQSSAVAQHAGDAPETVFRPNLFVSIDDTGAVTITAHRSEMGQGIRTTLPVVVADELDADLARVVLRQADGDDAYGDQNTDGSRSVRQFYTAMRSTGAVVRDMLVTAAAGLWGVPASSCRTSRHRVEHPGSGRSADYGELVAAAAALPVPDPRRVRLKSPEQFVYIGQPVPGLDLPAMTTGAAVYGADVVLPGMLVAVVARPPALGARVASLDASAAERLPGVRGVFQLPVRDLPTGFQPLGGVAVVADSTWAALRGREALRIEWAASPHAGYSSASYASELAETARRPGQVVREEGNVDQALARATRVFEAEYHVPHLAQAPMEPPAAIASVQDGRCELWAATQNPQATRDEVAQALGIAPARVTVHVTLLGGGFGRKAKPDFAVEAALLSRLARAPVRVQWTREDDLRHGFFHTVSGQYIKAGVDGSGRPVAWLQRSVFPSMMATFSPTEWPSDGEMRMGLSNLPFAIPNLRLERGAARPHLRIGWLRAVANIQHAFAIGSFADELAAAAGQDPRQYLLDLLATPAGARLRRVVEELTAQAQWSERRAAGHALGLAAHASFGSYTAAVVEVSVDARQRIRVERVHCAIDCGTVLNPDTVRAQMEGSVVFGMSLALRGQITVQDGVVEQGNFDTYPVIRMNEVPRELTVHLVRSSEAPGGVGEPGVPPIAPAIANAVFAATGQRLRRLPLKLTPPA
jgi:isoquinoline 1-oxidoreductase beta subunit